MIHSCMYIHVPSRSDTRYNALSTKHIKRPSQTLSSCFESVHLHLETHSLLLSSVFSALRKCICGLSCMHERSVVCIFLPYVSLPHARML